SLCMLGGCVRRCLAEHWEGKVGNGTFRQIAYHTLYFVDLYLSPGPRALEPREFHRRGGSRRLGADPNGGLAQAETLAYLAVCRLVGFWPGKGREKVSGTDAGNKTDRDIGS